MLDSVILFIMFIIMIIYLINERAAYKLSQCVAVVYIRPLYTCYMYAMTSAVKYKMNRKNKPLLKKFIQHLLIESKYSIFYSFERKRSTVSLTKMDHNTLWVQETMGE